jgi:hypothetical protein
MGGRLYDFCFGVFWHPGVLRQWAKQFSK